MMDIIQNYGRYAFGTAHDIINNNDDAAAAAQQHSPDNARPAITGEEFQALINRACQMGCRHFDCAPLYGTQSLLGHSLRNIIGHGGGNINLARSELFITSKLPVNMMRESKMEESLKMSLDELQLCYLDLFLVHAPFSTKFVDHTTYYPKSQDGKVMIDTDTELTRTWIKMSKFKEQGLVRLIGLSNVNLEQLNRLNSLYHVDVVQNEFHLYNQDELMREECKKLGVHYEGFAAMGSPHWAAEYGKQAPLDDPLVKRLASKYNKTPAQIIIHWLKTKEFSFVIKTDTITQLEENLSAAVNQTRDEPSYGNLLSDDDIGLLDDLSRNDRIFYYDNHKG